VIIDIKARTSQYERSLKRATRATKDLDQGLGKLGKGALLAGAAGAAAAIAGIGIASVKVGIESAKAFAQFETSISRIEGLVGVPKEELAGMTAELKLLSVETARGPQELADALFFITSAGLEGAEAMNALEVSARAATAGLGDTGTIADVVTSAMNAYGDSITDAGVATDVLVATVREGKAEAPALAASMGRVIPIASKMGVTFDQVGAAMAAMTRVGLDANESATALRAILQSLLKPGNDAANALDEVGLSAQGLRQEIRDKGLFSALQTMTGAFEGQDDAVVRVFGNVRALTGVMSLMGENAAATEQIFKNLAVSTGALDTAFGAAADTGAFAFEQAKVRIEIALLEVGEELLPKLADALDLIAPLIPEIVEGFGELAIIFADIAADSIPTLIAAFEVLELVPLRIEESFLLMARALQGMVEGLDQVLGPWTNFNDTWSVARERQLAWIQTQFKVRTELDKGTNPLNIATTAILEMADANTINTDRMDTLRETLGLTTEQWGLQLATIIANAEALGLTGGQVSELTDLTGDSIPAWVAYIVGIDDAAEAAGRLGPAAIEAGEGVEESEGGITSILTPLGVLNEALRAAAGEAVGLSDAMLGFTNPTFKAVKAVNSLKTKVAELATEQGKSKQDLPKIAQLQLDVVEATLRAQSALDALGFDPANLEGSIAAIQEILGFSRVEAMELLETLGVLDGKDIKAVFTLETKVTGPGFRIVQPDDFLRRAHGGPVTPGNIYRINERGEEFFEPAVRGRIVPNHVINNTSGARTINLEVNGSDNPVEDGESLLLLAQIGGM
jgi:TP901 family phage tail tape measure protein